MHFVTLRAGGTSLRPVTLDLAAPPGADITSETGAQFPAAGGRITSGIASKCASPDLGTLRSALHGIYGDRFSSDGWWIAQAHQ